MKTYMIMTPRGELIQRTTAISKAQARRKFLNLEGSSPLEVNKRWTEYRRQGFKIAEQLELRLFDANKENL